MRKDCFQMGVFSRGEEVCSSGEATNAHQLGELTGVYHKMAQRCLRLARREPRVEEMGCSDELDMCPGTPS